MSTPIKRRFIAEANELPMVRNYIRTFVKYDAEKQRVKEAKAAHKRELKAAYGGTWSSHLNTPEYSL